MDNQDGTGQHIWLRYSTQYSKDDRTHTIEMGIPIPLGASNETRDKLLREAEIGMSQLVQRVEELVVQALEDVHSGSATIDEGATIPLPQVALSSSVERVASAASLPSSSSVAQPTPSVIDQPPPVQTRPVNKPASLSAPQTASQTPNVQRPPSRTAAPPAQVVNVPPTRNSVGASMPTSLGPSSAGGNLTIPEFISYVDKDLHLKPRQAMELLQVKTLTGINLREALEKLKQILTQNPQAGTSIPQQQVSTVREVRPVISTPVSPKIPSSALSQATASIPQDAAIDELPTSVPDEALNDLEQERTLDIIDLHAPPPAHPARVFDEEEELEDLDEVDDLTVVPEISPEQFNRARQRISLLRQTQGAATAVEARLRALRNVADDGVSTEELQELVSGIWNIQSLQKLKKDQVEALISWAKEDDFFGEVEAVLFVLEEERYARGNR